MLLRPLVAAGMAAAVCFGCAPALVAHSEFTRLCLRAVDRPSENIEPLIQSRYWSRDDSVKDVLTDGQFEEMAALQQALCGEPVPGRDYETFGAAAQKTVYTVAYVLGVEIDPSSWEWGRAEWVKWLQDNKSLIRSREREERYRKMVFEAHEAVRGWHKHPVLIGD